MFQTDYISPKLKKQVAIFADQA